MPSTDAFPSSPFGPPPTNTPLQLIHLKVLLVLLVLLALLLLLLFSRYNRTQRFCIAGRECVGRCGAIAARFAPWYADHVVRSC